MYSEQTPMTMLLGLSLNSTIVLRIVEKSPSDKIYVTGAAVEVAKVGFTRLKTMKLIREEIESVKFLVEKDEVWQENPCILREYSFRETLRTAMVVCILWILFVVKFLVTMNPMFRQVRALGELGHPDGPTVNLDRVSHKDCLVKREWR